MNNTSNIKYFWFFTIGLILILIVSPLIQDGIFMDGMLYISVGKNLSEGIGTFWNQSFSQTCMFEYHEQPPLYGGLIALFFKIFGNSMYTERIFCFSFLVTTLYVIVKFWQQLQISPDQKNKAFLPILFFCSTPVVFWAYQNHVEETVMTLFDLLALYFIFKWCFKKESVFLNLLLSAFFIVLATLTKGIQGLFPVISIALIWLSKPERKTIKIYLLNTIYLVSAFILFYTILFLVFTDAYLSFKKYFSIRLVNTFNHVGATTENRFYLLNKLFTELIPSAAIIVIFYFLSKKNSNSTLQINSQKQEVRWLTLVGLSGSLPLMVTLEQRGFYLVTALPYFILSLSFFGSDYLTAIQLQSAKIKTGLRYFSIITLMIGISYSVYSIGKTKRDKELLHDVYLCKTFLTKGEIVGIPEAMWNDWNLQTYMVRYHYVSLSLAKNNHYFIIRKDLDKKLIPETYKSLNLPTQFLDVYELNAE
jgi:hypothetical protein